MLLVSKFDPMIDSIDKLGKAAGFKKRHTCKIHYNPLVTKYCTSGQLDTMVPYIIARDPRVIELNQDLKECTQYFLSLQSLKLKWEG